MHRRGGKRIRMDEPPPEYEEPATPATPAAPTHSPVPPASADSSGEYGSHLEEHTLPDPEPEDEEPESPAPTPTKRVTRSKGKAVGRLAESPPPPPVRRRRGGGRGRGGRHHAPSPPPQAYSPPPILMPGDDENSLYNILRCNKIAINTVVDIWIEQYKTHRESALVRLMQFFINASGCKGKMTADMASMEHSLIIKKMTQEFDEESGEYPLIMAGPAWKKFKANLCEFVQTLVKMCQYSIIYDQFLMDNIISLLTGLSDSQVRAFRHTATLAVMKLITALVDVALLTSVNCDNCQRQYEAERLKNKDKRATERLEVLQAKRMELEENMEETKNMLSYMFKSVFVHRYRDTLPEIRAITMAEIGIWMEKFPGHFLDDLYLKYIGWTLHDKVGEVRLKCLQALQPLYQCEQLKGKLELFTSKFKERIVAMSLDKEYEVAVHAVRLVILILKMHPDVLNDKDCENVYELVYSSHRHVAQAAGEFLNVRLFRPEDDAPELRSRRGKKRLPNTPLIRDLVQFFIESELHEHGAYLVDSLIESNPMMKDWECMTDLLLEEAGPGEDALDNRQESSLIELMVCCVRQASTGEPPVGRGSQRKNAHPSKEQNKMVYEDRQKLTVHFIPTLPLLLEKFGADPEKLTNLVSIPQYFDLEVYTTHRQEGMPGKISVREGQRYMQTNVVYMALSLSHFSSMAQMLCHGRNMDTRRKLSQLLNKLRDIVAVQTEPEVLEMCGRTLDFLCSESHAIYTKCNVARSTVTDLVVNRYKEAMDEFRNLIAGGEEPDPDEIFNVINSTRKVSIMYTCHNLNNTNIWESLYEDLPKCTKEAEIPSEALVYVLRSIYFSLLWSLTELEERLSGGADITTQAAILKERLHGYMTHAKDILASGVSTHLKEEAYTSICDLLVYFAEHLSTVHHRSVPVMQDLVYRADNEMCDLLNGFIQQFVFIQQNYDGQDERRIEELHKRRNFLAAYCKLIVYNMAPIRRASDVFRHYIKCYNDYGDIIKATVSKAREMNKLNCALTMLLAMQANFTEMLQNNEALSRTMQDFTDLKELAKRFSVMFGLDAVKNREAITALHRAGIAFAVLETAPGASPPTNILFLEILSEFTNKLIKQDRRVVLKFLDARVASSVSWGEEWQPLLNYRNTLVQSDIGEERQPVRRAYTRKRQQDEEEPENEESDGEQGRRLRSNRVRNRNKKKKLMVTFVAARLPTLRRDEPTMSPSINTVSPSIDAQSPRPDIVGAMSNHMEAGLRIEDKTSVEKLSRNTLDDYPDSSPQEETEVQSNEESPVSSVTMSSARTPLHTTVQAQVHHRRDTLDGEESPVSSVTMSSARTPLHTTVQVQVHHTSDTLDGEETPVSEVSSACTLQHSPVQAQEAHSTRDILDGEETPVSGVSSACTMQHSPVHAQEAHSTGDALDGEQSLVSSATMSSAHPPVRTTVQAQVHHRSDDFDGSEGEEETSSTARSYVQVNRRRAMLTLRKESGSSSCGYNVSSTSNGVQSSL